LAYTELRDVAGGARLKFEPTRSGVISWNTHAPAGSLQFRLLRAHTPDTPWLTHVEWTQGGRLSHSPNHDGVSVDIDVLNADTPFDGIDVHAESVRFDQVAFSSPVAYRPSLPYARDAVILDVPARSQYVAADERGWCSPTALSMLHAYHGIDVSVEETAAQVFDRAYNGTGNWSFNVAFSGRLGLRASVAYLPNLDCALRLIERNLPLAISYSWKDGELPGAPLEHSDGHLAVLRGFTAQGDCAVNDPAHPALRVVYPRDILERIWQRSGGVAYVIAPVGIEFADAL
jgi:hypothetical protein